MKPFTRADLNTAVRVSTGEGLEIGRVADVRPDNDLVLVSLGFRCCWYHAAKVERGRVVETWEPEE